MKQASSLIIAVSESAWCEDGRSSTICMGRSHIVEKGISSFPVAYPPGVIRATSLAQLLRFCYTFIASVGKRQRVSDATTRPNESAAGKVEIASLFAFLHHGLGLPEPVRSA
jgi:hypothetical protein